MEIPHNTIKDAERLKLNEQVNAFFARGKTITTIPDFDQPKNVELDGDMMKIYAFVKHYEQLNNCMPSRRRVSAELGLSAKKLDQYLLALDKLGRMRCNKHGVIVGVN
jgi:hypothetical protein